MKYTCLTILIVVLSINLSAQRPQHRCGSTEYLEHQKAKDPSLQNRIAAIETDYQQYLKKGGKQNKTIIVIPTVIHVVYNSTIQNIPDSQIVSQIEVLNEDYRRMNSDTSSTPAAFKSIAADCEIQFCLAKRDPQGNYTTGITRTQTTKTVFEMGTDEAKYTSTGGHDIWDRDQYLNIWVVPSIKDGTSTGILGYAQFPGGAAATDGVVIDYYNFGRIGNISPYYDMGRTVTHEVGHWLSLYHIWGDDGSACWGTDYVDDTPNQGSENYSCPTYPHASCNNTSDMYSNYMDYTDDVCMNIFTEGQKTRMWSTLNGSRSSLANSLGCVLNGIEEQKILSQINIYPNPTTDYIKIDNLMAAGEVISLHNILGQEIINIGKNYSKNIQIPVSDVEEGIYLIQIQSNIGRKTQKIQIIK